MVCALRHMRNRVSDDLKREVAIHLAFAQDALDLEPPTKADARYGAHLKTLRKGDGK
jgi:hypothetical protein